MSAQAILVHLPGPLYERLAQRAVITRRTLEAELVEAVRTSLPQEPDEPPPDVVAAQPAPAYTMREGAEALLLEHPRLYPVITEALVKLREHFGQDATFALERFRDPEARSAPEELHLIVGTKLAPDEARAAMDRFDDAWWFDNMERGEHLLHVTLEFA